MTDRGWRIQRNADGSGTWVNTDALDRFTEEHSREMQHRRTKMRAEREAYIRGVEEERERYLAMSFLHQLAYSVGWLVEGWKRRRDGL